MNKLTALAHKINKDFGCEIVSLGVKDYSAEKIPFTSPRLNYCLYGGLPSDKAVEFFGPEHSGKTTSALDIVANSQVIEHRKFIETKERLEQEIAILTEKNDNKKIKEVKEQLETLLENGPRRCVYIDAENTLDKRWAEKLGVDVDEMLLVQPQEQSAEQVLQMILDIIDTGQASVVVLDSIPMLVPKSIFEESLEKKAYCGVAGPLSIFCSKLAGTGRLSKNNTLLIGINQVREDISNPYNLYDTPGGRAWKHLAAVRLMFRHGSWFDEKGDELANKDAMTPIGNKVDVTIVKTKCSNSDRRLGFYRLNYNAGVDDLLDLLDVAIKFDLVQKGGAWYELPGGQKVQGIKAVREHFMSDSAEFEKLKELVNEKIIK